MLGEHGVGGSSKILTWPEAASVATRMRTEGRRLVFTNGCFDILHSGHISLLERAAAAAKTDPYLIVALNTDDSVRRLKGPTRPVNTEADRAKVLGALSCVNAIVLFDDDTPIRLIEAIKPDILVKGADYRKDQVVGGALVEANGGQVVLIDLVEGKSTTAAMMPGSPRRRTIQRVASHLVAPSESSDSRISCGVLRSTSSTTATISGKTITASTAPAASML